jgi:hypothetical protein
LLCALVLSTLQAARFLRVRPGRHLVRRLAAGARAAQPATAAITLLAVVAALFGLGGWVA